MATAYLSNQPDRDNEASDLLMVQKQSSTARSGQMRRQKSIDGISPPAEIVYPNKINADSRLSHAIEESKGDSRGILSGLGVSY